MREHKFRGKRINTGEWVYGYYSYNPVLNEHKITAYEECELLRRAQAIYGDKRNEKRRMQSTYIVDSKSVGECIDKKDEDDHDIYEADFLKDQCGRILLVEWYKFCFSFKAITKTNFLRARDISHWFENGEKSLAIIGNKFENPELFKEVK